MLKLIKNEKEFKIIDEDSDWALDLDCDFAARSGKNFYLDHGKNLLLKFKDNNGFNRFISQSKCVDGYKLNYKAEKNISSKSSKSSKIEKYNWLDFATNDEKNIIEEIKNNCLKRFNNKMNNPDRLKILEQIDELLKLKNKTKDEDILLLVNSKLEKLNKMLEELDKI